MAEHKQEPSIPKARKNGWEAVDGYFWGYIDTVRFTKAAVPAADSWKGSKSFHEYAGRCTDRRRAESDGPLQVLSLATKNVAQALLSAYALLCLVQCINLLVCS